MTVTGRGEFIISSGCCSEFLDRRRFRDLFSILLLLSGGAPLQRTGSSPFIIGAQPKDSSDSVEAELSSDAQSLDEVADVKPLHVDGRKRREGDDSLLHLGSPLTAGTEGTSVSTRSPAFVLQRFF